MQPGRNDSPDRRDDPRGGERVFQAQKCLDDPIIDAAAKARGLALDVAFGERREIRPLEIKVSCDKLQLHDATSSPIARNSCRNSCGHARWPPRAWTDDRSSRSTSPSTDGFIMRGEVACEVAGLCAFVTTFTEGNVLIQALPQPTSSASQRTCAKQTRVMGLTSWMRDNRARRSKSGRAASELFAGTDESC